MTTNTQEVSDQLPRTTSSVMGVPGSCVGVGQSLFEEWETTGNGQRILTREEAAVGFAKIRKALAELGGVR